ncbi:unnamed protein product [Adineta ricciae]|uniref:Uncharacterized protein n=1 Tax=Adineta ricciae TaxID=249248 RepID=A0A815GGQ6_ADIRI|nr:unnamed protein product [Adineta ricciae]CAF1628723.1 unnamed protein product [Adineta ricciae]
MHLIHLTLFSLFFIYIDGKRRCLTNCTVTGLIGQPLHIPDRCDQYTKASDCQVDIQFHYYDRRYTVIFSTAFVEYYYRSLYITITNILSYTAMFACGNSDNCATDFARKKVVDLSNRTINARNVINQLRPLLSEHRQSPLRCYDNEECTGICKIRVKTDKNQLDQRKCAAINQPQVHVFDGGDLPILDIECNRTKCNSFETADQVKQILYQNNLTDINGRINRGQKNSVSILLLLFFINFFIQLI